MYSIQFPIIAKDDSIFQTCQKIVQEYISSRHLMPIPPQYKDQKQISLPYPCQIILDQRKNKYNIQKGIDILHQTVLVRINKHSSFSFNNQMMNTAKRHQLIPLFHKKIRKSSLFKYRQIPSLSNVMNSKEFQYDIPKVTNKSRHFYNQD